jgi:SpoVK/Ycf46/Vps4 family AAA+-type ATPase
MNRRSTNRMSLTGLGRDSDWILGKSRDITKNVFTAYLDDNGVSHFVEVNEDPDAEDLVQDPKDPSRNLLNEIKVFLGSRDKYKKYKIPFKRGIVLYGPPGTGKTATVKMLSKLFVEECNGLVIQNCSASGGAYVPFLVSSIRKQEKKKPVLLVFDDIRQIAGGLVEFMDGQGDSSNCVFLFTTNYHEELPQALKRPSRTDIHIEIKGMNETSIKAFMVSKFQDESHQEVMDAFKVRQMAVTYAVLKEVMILKHIFGMTPDAALTRIKKSGADYTVDDRQDGIDPDC